MSSKITIYADCKKYEFNTDTLECEGSCPEGVSASFVNDAEDVKITLPGKSITITSDQFAYSDSVYVPQDSEKFDPAKYVCTGGKSISGASCDGYLAEICKKGEETQKQQVGEPVKKEEKKDTQVKKTEETPVVEDAKGGMKQQLAKYKAELLKIPEYASMAEDIDPDFPDTYWSYLIEEILLLDANATATDVEQKIAELAGGSDKKETVASQDQTEEKSDYSPAGDNGLKFSKPADWKPGQFVMLDDSDKQISPIPLTKLDDSTKSNTPASLNAFDLDAIIKNNKLNANKVELNGYPALVVSGTKATKTAILSLMETKWPNKEQFYLYVITNKLLNKGKLAAVLMNDYIKGIQSEPEALFGKIVTYHKGEAIDADQSYKLSYVDAKNYQELEPARLDQIENTYLLVVTNKELQTEETTAAQVKWLETQNCIFMETTEIQ